MGAALNQSSELQTLFEQIIHYGEWMVSASLLFIVAWVKFNSPPTNRSGTTFALFFFGVIFYYCMILTLWIIITIVISQSSIGLSYFGKIELNPSGQTQIEQYKPIFAALIIVVASQFQAVHRIDEAARAFCVSLAAIPREADRIALELTQTGFLPKSKDLQAQVAKFILENVGSKALEFAGESDAPSAIYKNSWLVLFVHRAQKLRNAVVLSCEPARAIVLRRDYAAQRVHREARRRGL